MIISKIDKNKLSIKFKYSPTLVESVKKCPNRKWNKGEKQWEAPLSIQSLKFLLREFPYSTYNNLDNEINQIKFFSDNHTTNVIGNFHTFNFNPQLYEYQKSVISKTILSETGYGIYLKPGLGKTFITLELIRYFKTHNISPVLIVCPVISIKDVWFQECIEWTPSLKIISLRDSPLEGGNDIYLINYEQLDKNIDLLKNFGFKILVLDESSRVKDYKSLTSKNLLSLSENIPYTYCLSGTPAPNGKLEYWTQLALIKATKSNFYQWRKQFFISGGYKGYDWVFNKSKEKEFSEQFKDMAIFLEKKDCLELPEQIFIPTLITLSDSERKVYRSVQTEIALNLENKEITFQNALAKTAKLRQVCNGFIYYNDGEGNYPIWESLNNSKLTRLEELLEEINEQVIIWIEFNQDKKNILDRFLGKYTIVCITGEESDKEKSANIESFKTGKAKILLANPKSAGHCLTFTNCHYQIYYSISFSSELFEQSSDRIHRNGQKKDCVYYILQARDTIDTRMYNVVKNKKKLSLDLLKSLI